jgi:hypothetical protein
MPKKSMWRVAHFDTLRLIARFTARSQASNSVRRQNLSRQPHSMRPSLFQSGSSILLKSKDAASPNPGVQIISMEATAIADLHAGGGGSFLDVAAEGLLADSEICSGAL